MEQYEHFHSTSPNENDKMMGFMLLVLPIPPHYIPHSFHPHLPGDSGKLLRALFVLLLQFNKKQSSWKKKKVRSNIPAHHLAGMLVVQKKKTPRRMLFGGATLWLHFFIHFPSASSTTSAPEGGVFAGRMCMCAGFFSVVAYYQPEHSTTVQLRMKLFRFSVYKIERAHTHAKKNPISFPDVCFYGLHYVAYCLRNRKAFYLYSKHCTVLYCVFLFIFYFSRLLIMLGSEWLF